MRSTLVLTLAILALCGIAEAQTQQQPQESEKIVVDVKDLPPEVVARIRAKQAIETLGEYRQYAEMGRAVGIAVDGALTAITKHTAEFASTGVGKFTMFIVAWKVLGGDVVHYTFGLLFFLVATCVFLWSWWKNCISRKVLVERAGKERKYQIVNDPTKDMTLHGTRAIHALVYMIMNLIAVAIVFGG